MKLNNVVTVEYSLIKPSGIIEIITRKSNMHTTNIVRKSKNVVVFERPIQIVQEYDEYRQNSNARLNNILLILSLLID